MLLSAQHLNAATYIRWAVMAGMRVVLNYSKFGRYHKVLNHILYGLGEALPPETLW
jgi:hypothetical protein